MGKMFFYAVAVGRKPGVYDTWAQCEEQVKGFQGAKFKKFASEKDAATYTGLSGKQAATIRAAGGNPSSITATISAVRQNRENSVSVSNRPVPPSNNAASSSQIGPTPKPKDNPDPREPLVVFCDGACKGNGQRGVAGLGVWWGEGDPRNLAERVPAEQTNNRAELLAIIRVLEEFPENGRALIIKSDSRYSIDCATKWSSNWIKKGWKKSDGNPVLNKELIHYLVTLLDLRKTLGQSVELEHVRGHVGILGNEMADTQANLGATKAEIPDEPDWASLRKEVERRIQNLRNTNTQIQASSTSNGNVEREQTTIRSHAQETEIVTDRTFAAELTADDYYDANDILSADDLEAEFNEIDA